MAKIGECLALYRGKNCRVLSTIARSPQHSWHASSVADDEAQATSSLTSWLADEASAEQSNQLVGDEVRVPDGANNWSAMKFQC